MNTDHSQNPSEERFFETEPAGFIPGAESDGPLPEAIGPFKIIALLGKGMSLVYQAEQKNPNRMVVLKVPRGGKSLSPELKAQFYQETKIGARLDHSAIIPVLESGEIEGIPYLLFPYIAGRNLRDQLRISATSIDDRLALMIKLCSVVQSLHDEHLIHRDLKPENILIDRYGEIRLLDFGLAQNRYSITENPLLAGTPQYMAPEQTWNDQTGKITPATDVYAIGVILFETLTGEFPYRVTGSAETQLEIIRRATPKIPSSYKSTLPKNLDQIILQCLEKDPNKRPNSAKELKALLENNTDLPTNTKTTSQKKSSTSIISLALPLLLIGALGLAAYLYYQDQKNSPIPLTTNQTTQATETKPTPTTSPSQNLPTPISPVSVTSPKIQLSPQPIPQSLWPLYEKAKKELAKFENRDKGAVILHYPNIPSGTEVSILENNQYSQIYNSLEQGVLIFGSTPEILIRIKEKSSSKHYAIKPQPTKITYYKLSSF